MPNENRPVITFEGDYTTQSGRPARILRLDRQDLILEADIQQFRNELLECLRYDDPNPIQADYCLDLQGTEFMSSAAYEVVMTADEIRKASRDKAFALVNIKPEMCEFLAVTKLNKVFDVYDDVEHFLRER